MIALPVLVILSALPGAAEEAGAGSALSGAQGAVVAPAVAPSGEARPTDAGLRRALGLATEGRAEELATVLGAALQSKEPLSDEKLLWDLADALEYKAGDLEAAMRLYRAYLAAQPSGRHVASFRERLQYLERHRGQWPLLREFREVVSRYQAGPEEAIARVEALLSKAGASPIANDLRWWLISELTAARRVEEAFRHLEDHLGAHGLPESASRERARALAAYADLLGETNRYGLALAKLEEAQAVDPAAAGDHAGAISRIGAARRTWWTRQASWVALAATLLGGLALRGWRAPAVRRRWRTALGLAVIGALGALVPLGVMMLTTDRAHFDTFFSIATAGGLLPWLLWLVSPLAAKAGRAAYFVVASLAVASALFLCFDSTKVLGAFERPFEAGERSN